jgi:hypothetical protein
MSVEETFLANVILRLLMAALRGNVRQLLSRDIGIKTLTDQGLSLLRSSNSSRVDILSSLSLESQIYSEDSITL